MKTPFELWVENRCAGDEVGERAAFEAGVRAVLATIGAKQVPCSKCQAPMWFVVHQVKGSHIPVSAAGCSHWADCPDAASFRKAKG